MGQPDETLYCLLLFQQRQACFTSLLIRIRTELEIFISC